MFFYFFVFSLPVLNLCLPSFFSFSTPYLFLPSFFLVSLIFWASTFSFALAVLLLLLFLSLPLSSCLLAFTLLLDSAASYSVPRVYYLQASLKLFVFAHSPSVFLCAKVCALKQGQYQVMETETHSRRWAFSVFFYTYSVLFSVWASLAAIVSD